MLQSSNPAVWQCVGSPTSFSGSVLRQDTVNHLYSITLRDRTVLTFLSDPNNNLTSITDRNGNSVTLTLSGNKITQVTSPSGRYIQFTYDSASRITQATDNLGRSVQYFYDATDASGRLTRVTDAGGSSEQYGYDTANRMTTVTDPRGTVVVTNVYDSNGRVSQQTLSDGAVWQFAYTQNSSGGVAQTTVTDPRGLVRQDTFNTTGYLTQEVLAQGQPEQQTYGFVRAANNQITSITDPLSRQTNLSYDSFGNVTQVTKLSGATTLAKYGFGYDPTYNQLAGYLDPLNHVTSLTYDSLGNLAAINRSAVARDLDDQQSAGVADDDQGRPQSLHSDLLSAGRPVEYHRPAGEDRQLLYRRGGAVAGGHGSPGESTQYAFDSLDRLTQVTDPLSGITHFTYDANGNRLTAVDPRG